MEEKKKDSKKKSNKVKISSGGKTLSEHTGFPFPKEFLHVTTQFTSDLFQFKEKHDILNPKRD